MYIKRKLEGKILKYLDTPEIIAVLGQRQSGKTTLLKKIYEGLESALFVTFEDKSVLHMFEHNIKDFAEIYVAGKKYLFIDEFQYAKKGGEKLKYIFDVHKIKIFISGSSAIDLTVNAIKYLVGRIFVFHLYPFDFEEFLSAKNPAYQRLWSEYNAKFKHLEHVDIGTELHDIFLKYFEEYTLFGGYPRVVLAADEEEKKEVLKNIYNTYFLREVRDILGLIDDYKLEKLIKALALQIGNLIGYKELGQLSEYPYSTLKKYLNFLEKTFICSLIRPYYRNKRTEIVKNPKVYFFDTGLRNTVVGDFRKLSDRPDSGFLLENALFQQAIKEGYSVNFWRDKRKHEIDFILNKEDQKEIAVEVKSFLSTINTDSVIAFRKNYPDIKAIFVYQYSNIDPKKEKEFYRYPIYVV